MKKKLLSLICITLLILCLVIPLAGCTPRDKILRILSQSEYIDEAVLEAFEEREGVTVKYESLETNEAINSQVKTSKQDYDLICVSDYMVEQMIRENLLLKPDFENIPNAQNISPFITGLMEDYGCDMEEYAVGYMWGTMGILYNSAKGVTTDDLDAEGWNILWNNNYSGIYMKDSMRDSFAIAGFALGIDANNPSSLTAIGTKLAEQKSFVTYEVDAVKEAMPNNYGSLSLQWAGDAIYSMELAAEYDNGAELDFYLPNEFNLFIDAYAIPAYAGNKELAEKFMDFLCEDDTAIANMDWLYYTTCVATPAIFEYYCEIGEEEEYGEPVDVSYFFSGSQYAGVAYDVTEAPLWWIQFPDLGTLYNGSTPNFTMMKDFGSQSAINSATAVWSNVRN